MNKLSAKTREQRNEPAAHKPLQERFVSEERSRLVVDIPKQLHRHFKQLALDQDRDLRLIVIDALTAYAETVNQE